MESDVWSASGERPPLASHAVPPYLASMRFMPSRTRLTTATLAMVATAATASTSLAQERPPDPNFTPNTSPVVGYIVMAVLFGIIVAISLLPSKRSHTDL